ncbi:DNA repair protein rad50 [Savitreella phatthalungensis]
MSSIDKLAIKGIRSFDNNQTETIQFFSPLTLIVGHNGSGKTTIIECLKYVTTGQLPPNSKGGAFVHDPKMSGVKDVQAQVKLAFVNVNGHRMVCTRSMQVTVKKKAAPSMKTLDGTLTVVKHGERSTISTRVAEMDAQMPLSLGVSPAILEYVIFCHQEDSAWPLSEPSVLKKRFDEIFEALKYTKALDQIKTVRKEQLAQVKIDTVQLRADEKNKERAERIRCKSDELLERISTLRTRITSLDQQMTEATAEQDRLFRSGQEFERTMAELDKFHHERKVLQDNLRETARDVEEYDEDEEALVAMQADYVRNVARYAGRIEAAKVNRQELQQTLVTQRRLLEAAMTDEGKLRAEADQYDRQVNRRIELINTIARQHNIRGFDVPQLDEEQVQDFDRRLTTLVRNAAGRLDTLRRDGRAREGDLNNDLQALLTKKTEIEQRRLATRQQVRDAQSKLDELQVNLSRDVVDAAGIATMEAEIKSLDDQINRGREALVIPSSVHGSTIADTQTRDQRTRLVEIDSRVDEVNAEIRRGQAQADTRAKLGLLQSDLKQRTDQLTSQLSHHRAAFVEATSTELNLDTLDRDIRQAQHAHNLALDDATSEHDTVAKEVSRLEAQLAITRDSFKQRQAERCDLELKVLEVFDALDDVEEQSRQLEVDLETSRKQVRGLEFADAFYAAAGDYARKQGCCQLCKQKFHKDFTVEDFQHELERNRERLPARIKAGQEKIGDFEADMATAKEVFPHYQRLRQIEAEMPALQTRVVADQAALDEAAKREELATNHLDNTKAKTRALQNLDRVASDMIRLKREQLDLQNNIDKLQEQLRATGSTRSLDDMQTELTTLQTQAKDIKKMLDQSAAVREQARQDLQILEAKRRDLQVSQAELQSRVREHASLEARIAEYRETITQGNATMTAAESEVASLEPGLQSKRAELDAARDLHNEQEATAQRDANRLQASQNALNTATQDINAYLSSGGADALARSRTHAQTLRDQCTSTEKRIEAIAEDIAADERRTADVQKTERNINDNLRLRRMRRDITILTQKIDALDGRNAERDRDRYLLETRRLKDRYSRLTTERAGLLGEITQMDQQLRGHQQELQTEFKDADEIHRRQFIKVRTMEKANEDLETYGKALDAAIMKYHALKMDEINKLVDELWKATYCGTDVDTILIRSEGDTPPTAANRSYNYRVCMVKGDAELDMRGRCSAGQKVLASIIIRLALAECFGGSCGILALDEPTTNLDRDNVLSLARSLSHIITARRLQPNFQLVVITHDEEFLRMMGCSDYTDYYFRVSRNEYQKSIIERQRVSTVL